MIAVPRPGDVTSRKQLRIAVLGTKGIPASYGGFETFAEQLAVRLAARGHDVTVYAEAESARRDDIYQGVHVRYRRRPAWGAASVLAYDCACLWDARQGFDVVYMLGYGAAWACWWPRIFGTPVWINVDGLEWARSKWGRGARTYLRCMEWVSTWAASRLIADAQAIADRFGALYPRSAPCHFIAYGAEMVQEGDVDESCLQRWGLRSRQYFLVVARPEPENHILEIIQGYVSFLQNRSSDSPCEWPLVVVGDVAGGTPYQQQMKAAVHPQVTLLGGIYDSAQLKSLRVHAAAYLHGHSVGGTNPSLLEAMACGNAVIAHDNPFNREVARDAAEYFSSPDELAQCLERMVSLGAQSFERRGAMARAIVAQHYTWDGIADAYEQLMLSTSQGAPSH